MDLDELLVLAENFGKWDLLKPQDKDFFETSSYKDVLGDINAIQSQREITKTMMNMTRIRPFLNGMAHLEKALTTIRFQHTAKVMAYVWGPVRFLLKVQYIRIQHFYAISRRTLLTSCNQDHESHGKSI
jgi:hypothetical protein